jgi:hypothetical protein
VPADVTSVRVATGDITSLAINTDSSNLTIASDVTAVTVQTADTTVITAAPATINLASLSFAVTNPEDVGRTASVGVSNLAARADHRHSAASLLLDGGNY